jgi:hypothetical protein
MDKIKAKYGTREDDPENARFLAFWEKFPLPFKYLGNGRESGGGVALVLVLEDAYDRESLEQTVIPSLTAPYTDVFLLWGSGSVFKGGRQVHNSY